MGKMMGMPVVEIEADVPEMVLGLNPEPEIVVEGEGRPDGPSTLVEIEAHGQRLRAMVPSGLEPERIEAMGARLAAAAHAMSYVPGPKAREWAIYDQAMAEIAALWGLARAEAQAAFEAWVRATPYAWAQAYWLIKAGNREALEAQKESE